jgi:UPF0176 protein
MQLPAEAPHRVAAFYRFARMDDLPSLKRELGALACGLGLRGTILVAPEGINGTVAGSAGALDTLVARLRALPGCAGMEVKWSDAPARPFHRMKVRLKREIVTMGVEGIDPVSGAGDYVEPTDWNALIADPDTLVVDTRNDYEVAIGRFEGAVDPVTAKFGDFPAWAQANRDKLAGRKVAMYCTGGIRCEKATAFVKSLGVEKVFHLRGGILKYLEEVPAAESLWKGECFVFDERVGVGHGLEQGEATLCRACRHPLTPQDRQSPHFAEGVSCHRCHDMRDGEDRERFAERHRQVRLAQARGAAPHIGR